MNIDTKVYRKHESPTFGNTLLGAVPLVSEVYLMDNIELMKHYPDKYFDLAVVDPPYGIGEDGASSHSRGKFAKPTFYTPKNWDKEPPPLEYFYELFRVSKNQIVWGANHFISRMPYDSSCWIIWDKENGENDFADCEMAWASFGTAVRRFKFRWAGMLQGNMKDKEIRMPPTQKPVALYDFIYSRYATEGMKILDTHLGSGSSRISANKNKLHFVGCEIDEEYFNKQNKRYEEFVSQARLW
jgi:site-specific DNA-methyltransferase (adenine-specific)